MTQEDEFKRRLDAGQRAYVEALGGKEAAAVFLRALEALREYATVSGAPRGYSVFAWAMEKGEEAAAAHRVGLQLPPIPRPPTPEQMAAHKTKVAAAQSGRLAQIERAKARAPDIRAKREAMGREEPGEGREP